MKKWQQYLIVLISVIIVIVISYFFVQGGKDFFEQKIVFPILKVYSEPCGKNIEQAKLDCDGFAYTVIKNDKKINYCWGECK